MLTILKNKLRIWQLVGIGYIVALLAACVPTSENPLPVSADTPLDTALYGAWLGQVDAEDDPVFLHFVKTQDGNNKAILVTVQDEGEPDGGWAEFDVTSSSLASGTFLNLFWTESDGEPVEDLKGIHLVRYILDTDGKLSLYFIDADLLQEAIENGTLEGDITSSGLTNRIRITASSDALADFVDSNDPDTLFSEFYGSFKKAI